MLSKTSRRTISGLVGLVGLIVPFLTHAAEVSAPSLKLPIPGINLLDAEPSGDTLVIPWIAQYASGFYLYATTIVGFLATIMIIIGGVQWATAGGNSGGAGAGKKKIRGGLIGVALTFGTYLILGAVSPDLVNFKNLNVRVVKKESIELEVLSGGVYDRLAAIGLKANPQLSGEVCDPTSVEERDFECYHGRQGSAPLVQADPPTGLSPDEDVKRKVMPYLYAASKAWDIDLCLVYATIGAEGGNQRGEWRLGTIGHDENFYTEGWNVPARRRFVGAPEQIDGIALADFCPTNLTHPICKKLNDPNLINKDAFVNEPPNYGLDWRFSHGIGLGQATLFGDVGDGDSARKVSVCPDGQRGITYEDTRPGGHGARCYTIPELLTVEGSIDATIRELSGIIAHSSGDTVEILGRYRCADCRSAGEQRLPSYQYCKGSFQQTVCGVTVSGPAATRDLSSPVCTLFEEQMREWSPSGDQTE
jgi:hypothetical protein